MSKRADDIGREISREQGSGYIEGERTCLTLTVFMSLTGATEEAWRNGSRALLEDVERAIRTHLPVVALGQPPVVICFASLPDEAA